MTSSDSGLDDRHRPGPYLFEQWQRSRDWLMPFMQNNQPKFLTKRATQRGDARAQSIKERVRFWMDGCHRGHRPPWLV